MSPEGLVYQMVLELLQLSPHLSSTDPSGKVRPEIINEGGNPSYKYFYASAEQGAVLRGGRQNGWAQARSGTGVQLRKPVG